MKRILIFVMMFFCVAEIITVLSVIPSYMQKTSQLFSLLFTVAIFIFIFLKLLKYSKNSGYFTNKKEDQKIDIKPMSELIEDDDNNLDEAITKTDVGYAKTIKKTGKITNAPLEIVDIETTITNELPLDDEYLNIVLEDGSSIKENTMKGINNVNISTFLNSSISLDNGIPDEIQQDYSKAIFLYTQNEKNLRENNDYPQYIFYELGISDPNLYHKQLIKDGYLESAPIRNTLNNFKVSELKEILVEHNLKRTGKKEDLIERIVNNLSFDELNKLSKLRLTYVLSEKGKEFLYINDYLVQLRKHSSWGITYEEYMQTKKSLKFKASFNDIAWAIFNERIAKDDICNNRNTYYHMYQILYQEKKYNDALYYLLLTLYYDLSGVNNFETIKLIKDDVIEKNEIEEFKLDFHFSQSILKEAILLKEHYSESMINKIYSTYELPFCCCPIELFKRIINDLFTKPTLNIKYYTRILDNNFYKLTNLVLEK